MRADHATQRRAALLCTLTFCAFGFTLGTWQALLPDLQAALALSPGQLGLSLTIGFIGALPAMFWGGRLITRWGAKMLLMGASLAMALALIGVWQVTAFPALVLLVLLFLGASGAYDVAINAVAIAIEQSGGSKILPAMHGAFSLSAAVGALISIAYHTDQATFRVGYLVLSAGLAAFAALMLGWKSLPSAQKDKIEVTPGGDRHFMQVDIVLVAGVVAVSFLGSGILENWSAIYVRTAMGDSVVVSSLGLASFHGAMAIGRYLTTGVLMVLDRLMVVFLAGLLMAVGMALSLATTAPAPAIAGLFVVGIALSAIAPIGFSLAGDLRPRRIGEISSVIAMAGYMSFLIGPVFIGTLASFVELRLALVSIVFIGLTISVLAIFLKRTVHAPEMRSL